MTRQYENLQPSLFDEEWPRIELRPTQRAELASVVEVLLCEIAAARAKISRAAINDRRFCAPERVGPKLERVKTDTGDPFPDQARELPGGQAARFAAAPSKQELPRLPSSQPQVIIDRLTGLRG